MMKMSGPGSASPGPGGQALYYNIKIFVLILQAASVAAGHRATNVAPREGSSGRPGTHARDWLETRVRGSWDLPARPGSHLWRECHDGIGLPRWTEGIVVKLGPLKII
jgi:hypothetical protein